MQICFFLTKIGVVRSEFDIFVAAKHYFIYENFNHQRP